jgi:hypothetical protein
MRNLDALFTQLYRKDPVLLAEWNVANRATPYRRATAAAPAPDPGSGGSSGDGGTPVVTS